MKNINQIVWQDTVDQFSYWDSQPKEFRPTLVFDEYLRESYGGALHRFNKSYRERKLYLSGIDLLGKYGEYFWEKGDAESALSALTEAIHLAPKHAPSHNRIASFYWLTDDCARALHHFRIARDLDPNDRDTVWNCGQIMIELGEFHSAKFLYGNYLKDNGPDTEVEIALNLLGNPKLSNVAGHLPSTQN